MLRRYPTLARNIVVSYTEKKFVGDAERLRQDAVL